MKFLTFKDPNLFLNQLEDYLLAEEVVNNLALGLLYALTREDSPYSEMFLACVEKENQPLLVMVMTPPHNLVVYGNGQLLTEAISFAIASINKLNIAVPGVIGPKQLAEVFSKEWVNRNGSTRETKMEQRIYKLEKVNEIGQSPGKLRVATAKDLDLVTDWTYDFSQVTAETMTYDGARKLAERGITESSIFIWDHEGPVSMAKKARPTKNGIVVNLVYTPIDQQRKGYATTCVAQLSQLLLNEGYKYCSLYTDLANPTSNSIYMKIGYEPVVDSVVYNFVN